MEMPARKIIPALTLVAAALLFATGGAAIKLASLTAWQIAAFRSGIAAAVLLLLYPLTSAKTKSIADELIARRKARQG